MDDSRSLVSGKAVEILKKALEEEGLYFLGISEVFPDDALNRLKQWISDGYHGSMNYLSENYTCRSEPRMVLEGCQSVVSFAFPYGQGDSKVVQGELPRIAQYARLRDYHKVLKKKGENAIRSLEDLFSPETKNRVVVDSVPVFERAIAAQVSGFIGKNTCYIDPEKGSFLLLGEIFTTHKLPTTKFEVPDVTQRSKNGGCGSCKRCVTHCPTGAIDRDGFVLNAKLCLSYWTIENRDIIPVQFWEHVAKYFFGCDICQIVCPYNRTGAFLKEPELIRMAKSIDPFDVLQMDTKNYQEWFGGTPVTRAKFSGLKRNALIAMIVRRDLRLPYCTDDLRIELTNPLLQKTWEQIPEYRKYSSIESSD